VVYPIPLVLLTIHAITEPAVAWAWFTGGVWKYLLNWGPVYRKHCEPRSGPWRGIAYGLGYECYIYTFYITVWRAVFRLVRGRNGWAKTRRNVAVRPTPSRRFPDTSTINPIGWAPGRS
jgi:1,2-diacylglycerol 3-beta-glucosyltransferase